MSQGMKKDNGVESKKVHDIIKMSRIGVGGCEASIDVLDYAYNNNIRVIDSGYG